MSRLGSVRGANCAKVCVWVVWSRHVSFACVSVLLFRVDSLDERDFRDTSAFFWFDNYSFVLLYTTFVLHYLF